MPKTYIVAETGSDLSRSDAERYNIKMVPMHVQIEGETRDDGTFPVGKLFESYRKTKKLPKTSAANPADFEKAFCEIKSENSGAQILHLAYSAVTTASYSNAIIASDGYENIAHVDTKQVSGGQRAIVLKMAQYIEKNPNASLDELKAETKKWINRAKFAFFPGDLEYLKAGGRVSNAAYLVASILGLKPLIEMQDGKLVGTKKYRGSDRKVYKKLTNDILAKNRFEKDSFFMIYSEGISPELKAELEKEAEKYGYKNIKWVSTGCVISCHCGPGAFGLGGFTI